MEAITITQFLGYTVQKDGSLLDAPCGCYACDEQVQQGHCYCDVPTVELLAAEDAGKIRRQLDNAGWYWVVN